MSSVHYVQYSKQPAGGDAGLCETRGFTTEPTSAAVKVICKVGRADGAGRSGAEPELPTANRIPADLLAPSGSGLTEVASITHLLFLPDLPDYSGPLSEGRGAARGYRDTWWPGEERQRLKRQESVSAANRRRPPLTLKTNSEADGARGRPPSIHRHCEQHKEREPPEQTVLMTRRQRGRRIRPDTRQTGGAVEAAVGLKGRQAELGPGQAQEPVQLQGRALGGRLLESVVPLQLVGALVATRVRRGVGCELDAGLVELEAERVLVLLPLWTGRRSERAGGLWLPGDAVRRPLPRRAALQRVVDVGEDLVVGEEVGEHGGVARLHLDPPLVQQQQLQVFGVQAQSSLLEHGSTPSRDRESRAASRGSSPPALPSHLPVSPPGAACQLSALDEPPRTPPPPGRPPNRPPWNAASGSATDPSWLISASSRDFGSRSSEPVSSSFPFLDSLPFPRKEPPVW
ncbi:hypothetical protein EYF80_042724 [Liparis tanakae]|uniref:Uncharacterized protein n=1 Tax=Liparis tanakae TaxID=230148 RepID=A0A4Z2G1L2_9TELE|nr:hypothetical protein EYF80_042724 [Liparis tanakae]